MSDGHRQPAATRDSAPRRARRVEAYRVYLTDGASTRSLIGRQMVPEIYGNL